MGAEPLDLSGWIARDEGRRWQVARMLQRLEVSREALAAILRAHGVTEAYVFGSAATGRLRPDSDVDIAVAGARPETFYRMSAAIERLLAMPVDVVDLDRAPAEFAAAVRREGRHLLP